MKPQIFATAMAIAIAFPATIPLARATEPQPDALLGALLGADAAAIAQTLSQSGYEMTKFERKGASIEVYATRNGLRREILIDAATGKVIAPTKPEEEYSAAAPAMSVDDLRSKLQEQGCSLVSYEHDDGLIEAYATRDGRRHELKIDPASGRILRAKEDM
jgi:hypothetical protein